MNKFLLIALFSIPITYAQQTPDSLAILGRKNEVRVDVLSAAAFTKFNFAYERFLGKKTSVGVAFGYAKSQNVSDDYDDGVRNTLPTYDVTPFFRYNLSKNFDHFYFAEVFLSANGGDFKEATRAIDENGNGYYYNQESTYFDIGAGAGLGYKWYIKDKFGIELLFGAGVNLFNKDKSPDILSRVGLNLGYRF